MKNLFFELEQSFNGFVFNLLLTGVILLVLAVLVVWVQFVVQIIFGLALLAVAWICFYAAYKLYLIKKKIKDFLPKF